MTRALKCIRKQPLCSLGEKLLKRSSQCLRQKLLDKQGIASYSLNMETMLPNGNKFTTHQKVRAHGHELLRRNVIEAASHLLVAEGPEALTVRRIAKALNCSTKIIYTMFSGKDGLADALYLEGCARLSQAIGKVAQVANPQTYVQEIAWAYWRFALANPSHYGVLFGGAIPRFQPDASTKQTMTQALETVARMLHVYMTQGLLPSQDPVRLTRAIWAPLHGVVSLHLLGHFSDEEEAKHAFERTVRAIVASLEVGIPPEAS
jgi:AcrR family transcriptional regulator